jgi:O-antigen/teichoic acid export membrane protein
MKLSLARFPGDRTVLANVASLAGSAAITLPLGFVFWWLAAQHYPPEAIGIASAAVSAMMLLSTISVLGLGTLLIGELPRRPGKGSPLLATALVSVSAAGLLAGCAFAAVAPLYSRHLGPLSASVLAVALFAAGVALTTAAGVLDQALIGVLRGGLQFWRNAALGVVKLLALATFIALPAWGTGMSIYGAWVLGTFVSIALIGAVFMREGHRPQNWSLNWGLVRELRSTASSHHAMNIALAGPQYVLPVIATTLISPRQGAYFYAAWMIAGLVSVIPGAFATVLYAVSAAAPEVLRARIRETLTYSVLAALAGTCAVFALGGWVLGLFGDEYASEAAWTLRIVALAGFPLIVRYHYVAVSRIFGDLRRPLVVVTLTSLLEVAGAAVGAAAGGLTGLSLCWLAVVCVEAFIMALPLYRLTHRPAARPKNEAVASATARSTTKPAAQGAGREGA